MSAAQPARAASLALWRIAQSFLNTLYALFGAPEDVAARDMLTAKPHALLCAWLRAGEALMRRLLLIEAAAIDVQACAPRPRVKHARQRRLMLFEADQPETWRVSFAAFSSSPARGGSVSAHGAMTKGAVANTAPARGGRFRSAWPLAERYEALLRVFNAPARYAKRLARKLARVTQAVLARLFRADPEITAKIDQFDAIDRAAFDAVQRRSDSS